MNKKNLLLGTLIGSSFLSGLFTGVIINKFKKVDAIGNLRIDNSDPDNPNFLFLELKVPVEYIYNEKIVTFNVIKKDYIRK